MRKAVEGDHPTVVYELEVMIRWVEERRRMGEELKKKKKNSNSKCHSLPRHSCTRKTP